jgi:hypothetical protein
LVRGSRSARRSIASYYSSTRIFESAARSGRSRVTRLVGFVPQQFPRGNANADVVRTDRAPRRPELDDTRVCDSASRMAGDVNLASASEADGI